MHRSQIKSHVTVSTRAPTLSVRYTFEFYTTPQLLGTLFMSVRDMMISEICIYRVLALQVPERVPNVEHSGMKKPAKKIKHHHQQHHPFVNLHARVIHV